LSQFNIDYRPQTFNGVHGQDKIVNELKARTLTQFPNVITLSGSTGTGKDCIAYIIAKTIQCSNPVDDKDKNGKAFLSPCNKCNSCRSINEKRWGNNTHLIDCANATKDDVIKLEAISKVTPIMGGKKQVFILDEYQALASERTKATFLTLLENPNPNAIFILTTMDVSKVPKAVLTRSVHYKLSLLNMKSLSNILFDVLEQIEDDIPDVFFDDIGSMKLLLESSNGSARNLLTNFERIVYGKLWKESDVEDIFEVVSDSKLQIILDKLDKSFFESLYLFDKIETFFYLSYEVLTESLVYALSGYEKNTYRKDMYMGYSDYKNNLLQLSKIYNEVFNSNTKYFKNAFFISKMVEYFNIQERVLTVEKAVKVEEPKFEKPKQTRRRRIVK